MALLFIKDCLNCDQALPTGTYVYENGSLWKTTGLRSKELCNTEMSSNDIIPFIVGNEGYDKSVNYQFRSDVLYDIRNENMLSDAELWRKFCSHVRMIGCSGITESPYFHIGFYLTKESIEQDSFMIERLHKLVYYVKDNNPHDRDEAAWCQLMNSDHVRPMGDSFEVTNTCMGYTGDKRFRKLEYSGHEILRLAVESLGDKHEYFEYI